MTNKERMFQRVYAIPGQPRLIDGINPATGLSLYGGRTAEGVAAEYPGAVAMAYDDWQAQAIEVQRTPIKWREITEERHDYYLNVLPPLPQSVRDLADEAKADAAQADMSAVPLPPEPEPEEDSHGELLMLTIPDDEEP